MNQILFVFLTGIIILVGAILINAIASTMGITTWFSFIDMTKSDGLSSAFREAGFLSWIFLFIVYPLLLGSLAWIGFRYLS